jgi:hypothetical protein
MGTIAFFIGIHVQFPHDKDPPDACQPENHPVVLNHPAVTMDFLSKFAEALQKKISGAIIRFHVAQNHILASPFAHHRICRIHGDPGTPVCHIHGRCRISCLAAAADLGSGLSCGFFRVIDFGKSDKQEKEGLVDYTKKKGW